ncbi:MAG: hypothetical protein V7K89_00540 [Nostoc sp.]|uniref:hypothetical protein n=1 Tax=Nostoc sp. TaxID=1180 RepID=UPI002FF9CE0F
MSHSKLLLTGNQSLVLDNPQIVWQIKSGAIALFAVPLEQGIEGVRRYLFSADVGEALFGISAENYKILAISIEDTELLQLTAQECEQWINHGENEAENFLNSAQIWEKKFVVLEAIIPLLSQFFLPLKSLCIGMKFNFFLSNCILVFAKL